MQLAPPKVDIDRVVVIARDPNTGRSKSVTVYNTTPAQVIEAFLKNVIDAPDTALPRAGSGTQDGGIVSKAADDTRPIQPVGGRRSVATG